MANDKNNDAVLTDGKVRRAVLPDGPASVVGEHSTAAGMDIAFIRYDSGDIGVSSLNPKTKESTQVVLFKDGTVTIMNPQIRSLGVIPSENVPIYTRMIRDLVDGAFPKGALQIVPLLERKSGNNADMLYFSARTLADVNTSVEGNGYSITKLGKDAILERLGKNGEVVEALRSLKEGAIQYDNPKVPNHLEPMVLDFLNTAPKAQAADNIRLAAKILADGVIDAKEAKEIGEAIERGKTATAQQNKRMGAKI